MNIYVYKYEGGELFLYNKHSVDRVEYRVNRYMCWVNIRFDMNVLIFPYEFNWREIGVYKELSKVEMDKVKKQFRQILYP